MNCVFVNACYGVILSGEEAAVLREIETGAEVLRVRQSIIAEEEEEEETDFDLEDAVRAVVGKERQDFLIGLRQKYGCGVAALLYHTGGEDDRVSGSETEPGLWILGYGLFAFPRVYVPPEFYVHATWHTWVTG